MSTPPPVRADMVETAVRFMLGPKVRHTPIEEQQTFLKGKGLTEEEIQTALTRVETQLAQTPLVPPPLLALPPSQPKWQSYANVIVLLAGGGYAAYNVITRFVLPRFFDIPSARAVRDAKVDEQLGELKNSLQFVMDSVQQTLKAVQQQQRAVEGQTKGKNELSEMKAELQLIKSLLLSRSQFPPIPTNKGPPSWQTDKSTTVAKNVTFESDTPDDSSEDAAVSRDGA